MNTVVGNSSVHSAYTFTEIAAICPITPSSSQGRKGGRMVCHAPTNIKKYDLPEDLKEVARSC